MKLLFPALFVLYLVLLCLQEMKRSKWIFGLGFLCLCTYALSCFYALTGEPQDFSILAFFSIGAQFALFLKLFGFRWSFALCLFVVALRMSGFSSNHEMYQKETLGVILFGGLSTIPILWGYFLVYHQRPYQEFLFLFLCFSPFYFFMSFSIFEINALGFFVGYAIISGCILWSLSAIRHHIQNQHLDFLLLCLFTLLSILYLQGYMTIILYIYFALGFIISPLTYAIFYFGEVLILGILCCESFLRRTKISCNA